MKKLLPFKIIFGRPDHKEIVDKIGDLVDKQKKLKKKEESFSGRGIEKAQKDVDGLTDQINEMIRKANGSH